MATVNVRKSLCLALLLAYSALLRAADQFVGLGSNLGYANSNAMSVSADGTTVVGRSYHGNFAGSTVLDSAFRWTSTSGMTNMGTLLGFGPVYASGVSGDGSVIVGLSGDRAFRWTPTNGMVGLGSLPGTPPPIVGRPSSEARGVSRDGSVVVGVSGNQAFRWTSSSGMTGLGFLPGDLWSDAYGVSGDGSVVVGFSHLSNSQTVLAFGLSNFPNSQAFRWTTTSGMTGLGFLPGYPSSQALGVSADGNVVVGAVSSSPYSSASEQAFRWTPGIGMVGLGFLPGATASRANGVSADGSVIVGTSNLQAFRWTQATGMQSVATLLARAGVAVPTGWQLASASATNEDGSIIVGSMSDSNFHNQAWLARISSIGNGILNDFPAFNATLIEAGSRGVQAGVGLSNMALFGAHHRSLLDSGLVRVADGACAWATVDAAGRNNTHTRMELVEVGLCKDIGATRIGIGIGQAWARQDWSLGGHANLNGQYLIAEAATAFGHGFEASVLGYYGRFGSDMRRNYMNGANVESSVGTPDERAASVRLRLDWKDAVTLAAFSLSPYTAYTRVETTLDAYAEAGGGFPATYAASTWRSGDLRVGLAGKTALSSDTDLTLALEAVHRLEDNVSGVNGQVIGLYGFNLPGQSATKSSARAIVDVDHRFSRTSLLTFSLNRASTSSTAKWGASIGYRAVF